MLLNKISAEHTAEIDRLEEGFIADIKRLTESEKNLKEQLEQFMATNSDLSFRLSEALTLQKKLQDEMSRT